MKRILYKLSVVVGISLMLSSCITDVDNYDEPSSSMRGNIIDANTGKNILTSTNDFQVRIWERSWGETVQPQDIPVTQDGVYQNIRLFDGTYDMQPYNGPFWPVQPETGLKLSGTLAKDFTVTPYLQITDFTYTYENGELYMSCKLKAPITEGLPNVREVRPFVSLTKFCGEGYNLGEFNPDVKFSITINKPWSEIGDMATGVGNTTYKVGPIKLVERSGLTYRVRLGANVNDTYKKYNYSEIVEINIP